MEIGKGESRGEERCGEKEGRGEERRGGRKKIGEGVKRMSYSKEVNKEGMIDVFTTDIYS